MGEKWRTRAERAKEIADRTTALALQARSAGLDVVAYMLELAAAEAMKELKQPPDTTTSEPRR
jgi:hypothetical protein